MRCLEAFVIRVPKMTLGVQDWLDLLQILNVLLAFPGVTAHISRCVGNPSWPKAAHIPFEVWIEHFTFEPVYICTCTGTSVYFQEGQNRNCKTRAHIVIVVGPLWGQKLRAQLEYKKDNVFAQHRPTVTTACGTRRHVHCPAGSTQAPDTRQTRKMIYTIQHRHRCPVGCTLYPIRES